MLIVSSTKTLVTLYSTPLGETAAASNIGDFWYVNRVFVPENKRGQGIGTGLVNRLIEEVRKQGGKRMIVEPGGYGVDPHRQVNFYVKLGFTPVQGYANVFEYILQ